MKRKQLTIVLLAGLALGACAQESADEAPASAAGDTAVHDAEVAAAGALLHRAGFYLVVLIGGGMSLMYESRANARLSLPKDASETE